MIEFLVGALFGFFEPISVFHTTCFDCVVRESVRYCFAGQLSSGKGK